ncbi:hypothetical protein VR010_06730 [Actinomycetaceae bacterium L2_0104]
MSWQPPMQIPRNSRISGRTLLTSVLAPIVGVAVAYLLVWVSLLLTPSLQELVEASGQGGPGGAEIASMVNDWFEGVPNMATSALILLAMGFLAPISATVSVVTEFGFPIPIQMFLWSTPLTVTVIVAVIVFSMHRRDCRKVSQAAPALWIPALLSGAVLTGLGLLAALFAKTRVVFSPPPEAGISDIQDVTITSQINIAWLLGAAFAIGLLAALLGRLNAIPARRATYALTSAPNYTPSIAHGIRVSFGILLLSVISTGIYIMIYMLLKLEDGVPASILFSALPFFVNIGLLTTLGSLGALGVATMRVPGDIAAAGDPTGMAGNQDIRELLFQDAPWTIWIMAAFVALSIIIGGVYWARTRDPRRERGAVSWLILPLSFTAVGALALATNMLVFSGSVMGEEVQLTARLSWFSLAWFFAMGLIAEIVARIARPKAPLPPTYSGNPQFPGAAGGPQYPVGSPYQGAAAGQPSPYPATPQYAPGQQYPGGPQFQASAPDAGNGGAPQHAYAPAVQSGPESVANQHAASASPTSDGPGPARFSTTSEAGAVRQPDGPASEHASAAAQETMAFSGEHTSDSAGPSPSSAGLPTMPYGLEPHNDEAGQDATQQLPGQDATQPFPQQDSETDTRND